MSDVVRWLLEGDPWVRYHTYVDLLGRDEDDPDVRAARQEMVAHPKVASLVRHLSTWPVQILTSHKSAATPFTS